MKIAEIHNLAVLDLTVLADMYGDNSADTVRFALSGFNSEAQHYVMLLQQALATSNWSEAARWAHRIKSMAGLCGAIQIATLCQLIEQAARQHDTESLATLTSLLQPYWQLLLQQSLAELASRQVEDG